MTDEKRIAEVVRILRKYGAGDALLHHYEVQPLAKVAADLIESLQLKLECRMEEVDQLQADLHLAYLNMESLQSLLTATIAGQETLQRALAASQAREEAAVEDIKELAVFHGSCFACAYFDSKAGHCGHESHRHICNCTDKNKWEWQGVQEERNG